MKRIHKLFWDYEKEEVWLNQCAARGLRLRHVLWGTYLFEDCTPGEYHYHLELLEHSPSHVESQNYLEFMQDAGVQCAATYLDWVYFEKKTADGPFELYSDLDSRIRHYGRMIKLWGTLWILNACAWAYNLIFGILIMAGGFGRLGDFSINFWLSFLSLGVMAGLGFLCLRIHRRIKGLKKQKLIYDR